MRQAGTAIAFCMQLPCPVSHKLISLMPMRLASQKEPTLTHTVSRHRNGRSTFANPSYGSGVGNLNCPVLLPMSTKKLEVSTLFLRHVYFRPFCVVRMPKTSASTRFVNENLDHPPVPSFPSRAASFSSLRQTRSPRPRICRSQRLLQSRERSLGGRHRCPTEAESPRLPRV